MAKITVEQVVNVAEAMGYTDAPFVELVMRLCQEYCTSKAEAVEALRIHWPDGSIQDVSDVAIDSLLIIEQAP